MNLLPVQIPKKIRGSQNIRKAMKDQQKIGWNNFVRGILPKRWGQIQLKYSMKRRKIKYPLGKHDGLTEEVTRVFLLMSMNIWKSRCELVHLLQKGTDDETAHKNILHQWFQLKQEPWIAT